MHRMVLPLRRYYNLVGRNFLVNPVNHVEVEPEYNMIKTTHLAKLYKAKLKY